MNKKLIIAPIFLAMVLSFMPLGFSDPEDFTVTCYDEYHSLVDHSLKCNVTNIAGNTVHESFDTMYDSDMTGFGISDYNLYDWQNMEHVESCSLHSDSDGNQPNDCEWTNFTDKCESGEDKMNWLNYSSTYQCINNTNEPDTCYFYYIGDVHRCPTDNRTQDCNYGFYASDGFDEYECRYEDYDDVDESYYRDEWVNVPTNFTENDNKIFHGNHITYSAGQTHTFLIEWKTPIGSTDNGFGSFGNWSINPDGYWNNSYLNRLNMTIQAPNEGIDHVNDFFQANFSGLTLSTNSCKNEPKLINGETEEEMDFIVVDSGGQALGDGLDWCIIGFNATVNQGTDLIVSLYYNNADATAGTYMDELIGFDLFVGMKYIPHTDTPAPYNEWTKSAAYGTLLENVTEEPYYTLHSINDASADYWYSSEWQTNCTYIIRFNTTENDYRDFLIALQGEGYGDRLEIFDGKIEFLYTAGSYGINNIDMQTYKITYDDSTHNMSMYVYNNTDGSAIKLFSVTMAQTDTYGLYYTIGDAASAGTGGGETWWKYWGLTTTNALPPLPFSFGTEESAPIAPYITITFNYSAVSFGALTHNTNDNSAPGMATSGYNTTIDTNNNFKLEANGTNPTGGAYSFYIGNLTVDSDTNNASLAVGNGISLTGSPQTVDTSIDSSTTAHYHGYWLSIPNKQEAEDYTSTITLSYSNI